MKLYTSEERAEAKKKLPKPVLDFLLSPTLGTIYLGIQKKHKLDLRQLMLFADIANITIMGLEPQSALETNLHQAMHELSNEAARELIADLNDRVFKEAQRRVRENILEPSMWSERVNAPKPTDEEQHRIAEAERIENIADDSPELVAAYKRDEEAEQERKAKQAQEDKEAEAAVVQTNTPAAEVAIPTVQRAPTPPPIVPPMPPQAVPKSGPVAMQEARLTSSPDIRDKKEGGVIPSIETPVRGPSRPSVTTTMTTIAGEKLGVPTLVKSEEVEVASPERSAQNITPPTGAQNTAPSRGTDPYREIPE